MRLGDGLDHCQTEAAAARLVRSRGIAALECLEDAGGDLGRQAWLLVFEAQPAKPFRLVEPQAQQAISA